MRKLTLLCLFVLFLSHFSHSVNNVRTGADCLLSKSNLLKNKKIALVVNQTSVVGAKKTHLADTLLSKGVSIKVIFAPEHGFRGTADAGEHISNSVDNKTGIPIVSLYGKNKKPSAEQLKGVDMVIFDIQDVGVRFYTYISTMYYVMEACADLNIPVLVLDRPNPNDFVEGPILQDSLRSFVGIVPVPILHGLTVGELALMMNGEGWLKSKTKTCKISVIKAEGWQHKQPYPLPVKPSPNLPNDLSIRYYPSLCLFEATPISIGRGTTYPFQVIGYPDSRLGSFSFTPVSLPGFDKNPLQKDKQCFGVDLRNQPTAGGFTLKYLIDFYHKTDLGAKFFSQPRGFDQLMGNRWVREMILQNKNEAEISQMWQKELNTFKVKRRKYLLYPEK